MLYRYGEKSSGLYAILSGAIAVGTVGPAAARRCSPCSGPRRGSARSRSSTACRARTTGSRIRLSQASLAAILSLSRQTTNPLLKRLESQEIVSLKSGEIAIRDFGRPRAASLGDARSGQA